MKPWTTLHREAQDLHKLEWHEIDGGRYMAGGRRDCRARMLRSDLAEGK